MTASKKSTPAKSKTGKSLDDFRAAHDKNFIVPKKIEEALKKLGEGWEYEVDFIRLCGLSTTDFAMFREQFEGHYINVGGRNPKRVWSGSKATIAKMSEMI